MKNNKNIMSCCDLHIRYKGSLEGNLREIHKIIIYAGNGRTYDGNEEMERSQSKCKKRMQRLEKRPEK